MLNNIYNDAKSQMNICLLVGNGFDIRILKNLVDNSALTTYQNFLKYEEIYNHKNYISNSIFNLMKQERKNGNKDWSDIELAIHKKFKECRERESVTTLFKDVRSIRLDFARFLSSIISYRDLMNIYEKSSPIDVKYDESISYRTFSRFSWDIDKFLQFNMYTDHYQIMNWNIINFNYTSILENYLQLPFDPHPYKYADRNFRYELPIKGNPNNPTRYSDYLVTNYYHPHGSINIPSKILLGLDIENYEEMYVNNMTLEEKSLIKPIIAQDKLKYSRMLNESLLFILFGVSIGSEDRWWWRSIIDQLRTPRLMTNFEINGSEAFSKLDKNYCPELIIYMFCDGVENMSVIDKEKQREIVKNKLLMYSPKSMTEEEKEKLKDQIFIVLFDDNTFLNAFALPV